MLPYPTKKSILVGSLVPGLPAHLVFRVGILHHLDHQVTKLLEIYFTTAINIYLQVLSTL